MDSTPPSRASARQWSALAVLLLPALLTSMDISVLFVAAPAITEALEPSATQWLWMMDSYGFVMAGLLITMGSLGDRVGRRKVLLVGSVLFGAASALVAFASSAELLIAGRVLLGIGAATLAPSTLSLVRDLFPDERQRRVAVGAWTTAFTGGAVAGPIVGGILLENFWWGSVFLINIPVMLMLLLVVPFLVPESARSSHAGFDLAGAATSLVAILALVFAVKNLTEHGLDATTVAVGVLGVLFLVVFLRGQRSATAPLIDVSLFRDAAFTAAVGSGLVVSFAAAGLGLLAFTFLQTVHDLGPLAAALHALPTFAGTFAGAVLGAGLAGKVRPGVLLCTGLLIGAAGFCVVGSLSPTTPVVVFIAGYTVLTLGVGIVGTLANSLVLGTAPAHRAGAAAGISETSNELGAALGIAALGTVSATVYKNGVGQELSFLPPEATETVTATVQAADVLAEPEAADVRSLAFDAFTSGVNVAAFSAAGVLAVVAVLAALALRRTKVPAGHSR
ncbi:MFS transporter [Prauserella marina]|uniref:MFS transporter, DHA2 family, multidrug resistance protein n=1 Tax=Prauserella marina TaxID=530584 RepID=A0A222VQ16_9PSEU|nr:MFS transporter [Prauserella marina]ASR36008.1 MFS transporter [Prauserella marina]PWV84045.1 DHA2 family multidrug resistance protein-like MFS transporter [Prauserella marina]SDC31773.1 MFS transporter, DHA2 family, multidrug resistance protein [Prauserella marina]